MLNMSTQLNRGSRELSELLNVISNADQYTERLKTLSDAEQAAIRARDELTKAKDLDAELKKVKDQQSKIDKIRVDLLNHFDDVKKKAEHERHFILTNAQNNASTLIEQAKTKTDQAEQYLTFAKSKHEQALAEIEQSNATLEQHDEMLNTVKSMKKEYLDKLRKIEQLVNDIRNY